MEGEARGAASGACLAIAVSWRLDASHLLPVRACLPGSLPATPPGTLPARYISALPARSYAPTLHPL